MSRRRESSDARWIRMRAIEEMQHRSVAAGFRRGKLTGKHPSELRTAAHRRAQRAVSVTEILIGAGVVTGGFFIGQYLGRKIKEKRATGPGTYMQGLDALSG